MPVWDLNVPIADDASHGLRWLDVEEMGRLGINGSVIFLGLKEQQAYFAIDIYEDGPSMEELQTAGGWKYVDARTATEYLSGSEAGIVAQARAQINWHHRHGFCSICGKQTSMTRGGQVRRCTGCNAEHFPRTDPVVITLVSDNDRCLLGQSRGRVYGTKMYSALAGFIDQGESIEEAVTRELMEESGIRVKNIRYHSSQPWPFPWSLMIGCHADAVNTDISMDDAEMADVRWFNRDEVLLALEGKHNDLEVPGPIAIAHHLIKAWATGEA